MTTDKPIKLQEDCQAALVPSGEKIVLPAGSQIWITQALGGSYTVMTDHGHVARIDGEVGERLGFPPGGDVGERRDASIAGNSPLEKQVWAKLRTCFDPEIPVNIVDLGLIYDVEVSDTKVAVKMTLTAPGCGMGGMIAADAQQKILALDGVDEATVDLVWDPPWNPSMIAEEAKQRLGIV